MGEVVVEGAAEEQQVVPGEVLGGLERRGARKRQSRDVAEEFGADFGGEEPVGIAEIDLGVHGGRVEAAAGEEDELEVLERIVGEVPPQARVTRRGEVRGAAPEVGVERIALVLRKITGKWRTRIIGEVRGVGPAGRFVRIDDREMPDGYVGDFCAEVVEVLTVG